MTTEAAPTTNTTNSAPVKRRLSDFFMQNKVEINYKDTETLKKFLSPEGKILPARRSGLSIRNQKKLTTSIKQARILGLLPYTTPDF